MTPEENQKLLKEFTPQFITSGIAGMFASDEYNAVEIKLTFFKTKPKPELKPEPEKKFYNESK